MEDLSNEARKENIRRAARRKVLVQLTVGLLTQRGTPITRYSAVDVVRDAELILIAIEASHGADW